MRIQLLGDAKVAQRWIPYARRQFDKYARYLSAFNQHHTVERDVTVQVFQNAGNQYIRIVAGGTLFGYEFLYLVSLNYLNGGDDEVFHGTYRHQSGVQYEALNYTNRRLNPNETLEESLPAFQWNNFDPQTDALDRTTVTVTTSEWFAPNNEVIIGSHWVGTRYHDDTMYESVPSTVGWPVIQQARRLLSASRSAGTSLLTDQVFTQAARQGEYLIGQIPQHAAFTVFANGKEKSFQIPLPSWVTDQHRSDWYFNRSGTRCVSRQFRENSSGAWQEVDQGIVELELTPGGAEGSGDLTLSGFVSREIQDIPTYAADYDLETDELRIVRFVPRVSNWVGDPATQTSGDNRAIRELVITLQFCAVNDLGQVQPAYREVPLMHIPWLIPGSGTDPLDEFGYKFRYADEDTDYTRFSNAHGYQYIDGSIAALDLRADAFCVHHFRCSLGASRIQGDYRYDLKCFGHGESVATVGTFTAQPELPAYPVLDQNHPLWQDYIVYMGSGGNFVSGDKPLNHLQRTLKFETLEVTADIVNNQPTITGYTGFVDYFKGFHIHPDKHWSIYNREQFFYFLSTQNEQFTAEQTTQYSPLVIDQVMYFSGNSYQETSHLALLNESRGLTLTYDYETDGYNQLAATGVWVL